MKSAFLIAAPMSGSGKTTIARGLMALFYQKGYKVQPFKCGPDYIDTKFHEAACGRPSINLDTFMATPKHVRELFAHGGKDADVCIVEGMMGLFDGYDREKGSTYEIARVLGLPIVLVADAKRTAYSMAALLSGFIHFRSDVRIAGVIYNKVGSSRHAAMLRQVCDDINMPCLGCIPKSAAVEQSSRYLGLDFSKETNPDDLVRLLADNLDFDKLLVSTSAEARSDLNGSQPDSIELRSERTPRKTLVAKNEESFSFIYQETLERLGDIHFFNPETDTPDFTGTDLLYLPGGYPEKHTEALAANETCRTAIRNFAESGGSIIAECGGMMYLCRSIITDDGEYPMCAVLPYDITARRADRRLSLGYRRFELEGREYRGHEFHYSQFADAEPPSACQVYDAKGNPVSTPVIKYKNVLASYTHLYQI